MNQKYYTRKVEMLSYLILKDLILIPHLTALARASKIL